MKRGLSRPHTNSPVNAAAPGAEFVPGRSSNGPRPVLMRYLILTT